MNRIAAGAGVGFAGTGVLRAMMGVPAGTGWIGHFVIGTRAWVVGVALLSPLISGGSSAVRGVVLGPAASFGVTVVAPRGGAGLSGRLLALQPVFA